MARSCIHFNCEYCGIQHICLSAELMPHQFLTCMKGHVVFLKEDDREKINMAFRAFVDANIDVFL